MSGTGTELQKVTQTCIKYTKQQISHFICKLFVSHPSLKQNIIYFYSSIWVLFLDVIEETETDLLHWIHHKKGFYT